MFSASAFQVITSNAPNVLCRPRALVRVESIVRSGFVFLFLIAASVLSDVARAETETVPPILIYYDASGGANCGGPSFTSVESLVACLLEHQLATQATC